MDQGTSIRDEAIFKTAMRCVEILKMRANREIIMAKQQTNEEDADYHEHTALVLEKCCEEISLEFQL